MRHLIRHFEPGRLQHIITKTIFELPLLTPSKELTEELTGIIARFANHHRITLYGFVVLPDGVQLLLKGPDDDPCLIAYFMQDLKSQIARTVGRLTQHTGCVFSRRYLAIPVLDTKAAHKVLTDMHAAPVKQGLAPTIKDYQGLCSANLPAQSQVAFNDRSAWHQKHRPAQMPTRGYQLTLQTIPLIKSYAIKATAQCLTTIKEIRPTHASSRLIHLHYQIKVGRFEEAYNAASGLFRMHKPKQRFPCACFTPRLAHVKDPKKASG